MIGRAARFVPLFARSARRHIGTKREGVNKGVSMAASSKLLINEHPLQTLPTLAKAIGLDKAVILQQIQYWVSTSPHEIKGHQWIYNSYTEWALQFPWLTPEGVRYHIRGLEKAGLIVAGKFNKDTRDKTKWYRINYTKLNKIDQSVKSLTETTPETTEETTLTEKKAEPSPVDIIFKAIHAYYGFPDNGEPDPIPSYGKEGGAIKHMLKRGFTPAQIMECWSEKTKKRKSWVTMVWVNDDISGAPVMMESDKYANQKYGHMVHR